MDMGNAGGAGVTERWTPRGESASGEAREDTETRHVSLDDDDDQLLPAFVVLPRGTATKKQHVSHHYTFAVPVRAAGDVLSEHLKLYTELVEALAARLGPRLPYTRGWEEHRQRAPGDMDPEESGNVLRVASGVVPSPSVPYVPASGSQASHLQYARCGACDRPIRGARYDCNNCPPTRVTFSICSECHAAGRKTHGGCKCNTYFQDFNSKLKCDRAQLFLFRYYSAVVSMPQDYMVFAFAPAYPHYNPDLMHMQKMFNSAYGNIMAMSLWTTDSRDSELPTSTVCLADFDVQLARSTNAYTLSFGAEGSAAPSWTRTALPAALMHCSPADVRACVAVSRTWYQCIKDSQAMARAKVQHVAYGQADEAVARRCNGPHWGAALKLLLTTRKYVRLMAVPYEGDAYLLLDVNLGLWRAVRVSRAPDSKAAAEARRAFTRRNPGYVD